MISKFGPSWNVKLTWSLHKVKMISKVPPPWNFKLTWSFHKVKMISNSHHHGIPNWLGVSTKLR